MRLQTVAVQTEGDRGFTVPMGDWLRGPLREMFEDLLYSRDLLMGLEINQKAMRQAFQEHPEGRSNREWSLWIFLSLALWEHTHYKKWLGGS